MTSEVILNEYLHEMEISISHEVGGSGGCRILGGNDGTLASTTEDLTVGAHQVTLKTASMSTQALTDDSNF